MPADKQYADLLKLLSSNKELTAKVFMDSMMEGVNSLLGKAEESDPNEAEPDNDVDDITMNSTQTKKGGM